MLPTITVDVGTTSVKLCLFDDASDLVASDRALTPTTSDAYGEIYDLEALHAVIKRFIGSLTGDQRASIRRVAFAGVGESGGLVRSDLTLASPMILWHDHRGAAFLEPLDQTQRRRVYEVTGLPVNANYGLSKIAWALQHAGDTLRDTRWLNIAEYLAATMTGIRWSEYSLASRTMALDLRAGAWSSEIAGLVGVETEVFPELRPAGVGAVITPTQAKDLGLPCDVEVHVAGHDHMVGGVGADLRPGELLNSTGTTEGLLFLREEPWLDGAAATTKLANGRSCTGDGFTLFASIPTGGSAFATLQHLLAMEATALAQRIGELAERYTAGSIDLSRVPLVVPQFRGSPPPTKQAAARGLIAGLSTDTTADEIILGTFLGMTLQFRDVLELFHTPVNHVKVIGPASRNALWLQLKADLLGIPLSVSEFPEVVSKGAQVLASQATARWEDCAPVEVHADEARTAALAEWSDRHAALWRHLKNAPV